MSLYVWAGLIALAIVSGAMLIRRVSRGAKAEAEVSTLKTNQKRTENANAGAAHIRVDPDAHRRLRDATTRRPKP